MSLNIPFFLTCLPVASRKLLSPTTTYSSVNTDLIFTVNLSLFSWCCFGVGGFTGPRKPGIIQGGITGPGP